MPNIEEGFTTWITQQNMVGESLLNEIRIEDLPTTDQNAPNVHDTSFPGSWSRGLTNPFIQAEPMVNEFAPPRYSRDNDYGSVPLDSWMTRNGEVIKIENLKTDHLFHILGDLNKDQNAAPQQRNKMVTLEKEAMKRLSND